MKRDAHTLSATLDQFDSGPRKRYGFEGCFIFQHCKRTRGQGDRNSTGRGEYREHGRTPSLAAAYTGIVNDNVAYDSTKRCSTKNDANQAKHVVKLNRQVQVGERPTTYFFSPTGEVLPSNNKPARPAGTSRNQVETKNQV